MIDEIIVQTLPNGEDDVRTYLQHSREYPLLTAQQEWELAKLCSQDDEVAIRRMVGSNLRLVVSIAREYTGRGVPLVDLVQEGCIGLLGAAKKFDHTRQLRFSTYATKWIRQGISRCLMNHDLIRVPAHTLERIRKVQKGQKELTQQLGAEPSLEEIAAYCGMKPEQVEKYRKLTPELCSLDTLVGAEEDSTLGDLLEDPVAVQPYERLVREELKHILLSLLATLDERQQYLLRLRFGLEDGTYYTQEQVGELLGISKQRARQLEQQAMAKLRVAGEKVGLEDFLE